MIDFKYPSDISEWKALTNKVEEKSNYEILCGACGVVELGEIATTFMKNVGQDGISRATEKYLEDIGTLCMENVPIGIKLYLFLLGGCKAKNIEIENELTNLPTKISFNEINKSFIADNFEKEKENGNNIFQDVILNLSNKDKEAISTVIDNFYGML